MRFIRTRGWTQQACCTMKAPRREPKRAHDGALIERGRVYSRPSSLARATAWVRLWTLNLP